MHAWSAEDTTLTNIDETVATGRPGIPKHPLVVLKQSVIRGRIFFVLEVDKQEPADKLHLQIIDPDSDKLVYETDADEKGAFSLPNLEVGKYKFLVGRLILELRVEELTTYPGKHRLIPKTILIFMSRDLK